MRESRLATSFFEGRRRFRVLVRGFSILEMKTECFIWRLSFLFVRKVEVSEKGLEEGMGMAAGFRTILARLVVRFLGATGAY